MKRTLILILSFFTFISSVLAFELVYPTEKSSITTGEYALFAGQASGGESIQINDEKILVASNGAFAHSVKLKEGENRVKIKSDYGIQFYKIYKTKNVQNELPTEEFEPKHATVNSDNTPLRSTPVDAGLNRMSHLFAGTNILINGSQGSFYRVLLSEDKSGWIAKDSVTLSECIPLPAEFITMDSTRYKNAVTQTITMSARLPYTIEDGEKEIIFRVYNPFLSTNSVYNINIPKPKKYLYKVSADKGKYTFKVKEITKDIQDLTIAVDAGHGGSERGAIGCLGIEEKTINLKIAQELASELSKKGFNVVMTREFDGDLALNDRVNIAKDSEADIFISIHLNSVPANKQMDVHKTRGTEVYYFNNSAKSLAETLEKTVSSSAGTKRNGIYPASFAVIRPTDYVGVLVEAAYMTNPLDSTFYTTDKFAKNVAKGITKGICEFIGK